VGIRRDRAQGVDANRLQRGRPVVDAGAIARTARSRPAGVGLDSRRGARRQRRRGNVAVDRWQYVRGWPAAGHHAVRYDAEGPAGTDPSGSRHIEDRGDRERGWTGWHRGHHARTGGRADAAGRWAAAATGGPADGEPRNADPGSQARAGARAERDRAGASSQATPAAACTDTDRARDIGRIGWVVRPP
jgi:hypothetical protein